MDAHRSFGDYLRFLRRRSGLSSTDLAQRLGYRSEHLNALESNRRAPDADALLAFVVPALDLAGDRDRVARLISLAGQLRAELLPRFQPVQRKFPDHETGMSAVPDMLSAEARALLALLTWLETPIDVRSAVVGTDASGRRIDTRAAAELLLQHRWIASISEAVIAPENRLDALATVGELARRQAASPAASVIEALHNDVLGAVRLVLRAGDTALAADMLCDRSDFLIQRGDRDDAIDVVGELLRLARKPGQPVDALRIGLTTQGQLLLSKGQFSGAADALEEAMLLTRLPLRQAHLDVLLAESRARMPQSGDVLHRLRHSQTRLSAADAWLLSRNCAAQSELHYTHGQPNAAAESAEQALWLADSIESLSAGSGDMARARANAVLGRIHRDRGVAHLALHHFEISAEAAARTSMTGFVSGVRLHAARLQLRQGVPVAAGRLAMLGLDDARAARDDIRTLSLLQIISTAHMHAGQFDEAEQHALRAFEIAVWAGLRMQQTELELLLAEILLYAERADEADAVLTQVIQAAANPADIAAALQLQTHARLAAGELPGAHVALDTLNAYQLTIRDSVMLNAEMQNCQAAFALARGNAIEALLNVATAHPTEAGLDREWRRQLIEARALHALGSTDAAHRVFSRIERGAPIDGFTHLARVAARARRMVSAVTA
jgi:transcriptional regulator with XRE-family HTH domain